MIFDEDVKRARFPFALCNASLASGPRTIRRRVARDEAAVTGQGAPILRDKARQCGSIRSGAAA